VNRGTPESLEPCQAVEADLAVISVIGLRPEKTM